MDAYHDTYISPKPMDGFLRHVNEKASIPVFRELLSPSGSGADDVRDEMALLAGIQRLERRKGAPVSRRSADTLKLIRYQRNGTARLSRAILQRPGKQKTKRSQIRIEIMAWDK
jgi:hypothetical protein